MVDESSKKFDMEIAKGEFISSSEICRRHRNASLSYGEIMTILIVLHFGTFANFKHCYLHYIRVHLHQDFQDAVFYNRFVELESRVFFKLMFFLKLYAFGHCSGISFVDSTILSVITSGAMPTRFSRAWLQTEMEQWDGVMDSSCTSPAMTGEKSSPSVLPEPMWMTGILESGTYSPKNCTTGFLLTEGTFLQDFLRSFLKMLYISLQESKRT